MACISFVPILQLKRQMLGGSQSLSKLSQAVGEALLPSRALLGINPTYSSAERVLF